MSINELKNELTLNTNDNVLKELLLKSLEESCMYDIAQVVHYMYKDTYVVGRLKNKIWFHFETHKWKQTELGPYYELSTVVLTFYINIMNELLKLKEKTQDVVGKVLDNTIHNCDVIIRKLKNVNYKEQICKECLYLFYDSSFMLNLDRHINLICFRNGVYDTVHDFFRDGKDSDNNLIFIDHDYIEPCNDEERESMKVLFDNFNTFRYNILKKRDVKNAYVKST